MVVSVGYAEVQADEVTVVVNAAEFPETIDRERAERALERAEAIVLDPKTGDLERTRARHAVRRAKARIDFHKRFFGKEKR
jgi:F-type H+-transporting ATPase subunit epsilon